MKLRIAALLALLASAAVAQHHPHGHGPSAGMQQRGIKALSQQQLADLRAGKGMGLALAAELNGYPGPLHVIELADRLSLTTEQRQQVQQLYDAMLAEAIATGEQLIDSERALDAAFAAQTMTPDQLALLTTQIGERQGALRAVHLKYHLTTAALLTLDQRGRYGELRGYRR